MGLWANVVTIAVALIAAGASIVGAVVAYRAASRAAGSSEKIASEGHGVAAIDRQADQLATAFDKFIESFADARDTSKQLQVCARIDQLAACTASTRELERACDQLIDAILVQTAMTTVHSVFGPPTFRPQIRAVSNEYREAQRSLATKRDAALSKKP